MTGCMPRIENRDTLKVAALQLCSKADKKENTKKALELIQEARTQGARLVVLPEAFNCYCNLEDMVRQAEPVPGPTINLLAQEAKQHKIYILCGSILEKAGKNRVFNASVMVGPEGDILGVYRKVHLFDVHIPGGLKFQESRSITPGRRLVVIEIDGLKAGLAICYDLRFPELFRTLRQKGAELMLLPSAFTAYTGKDHWEVLLRARAIENQVFVVAANQFGTHPNGITTYGRSMIIDPWGAILSQAPDKDGFILAELYMRILRDVRRRLPVWK